MRRWLFPLLAFSFSAQAADPPPAWWEETLGNTQLPIARMEKTLTSACRLTTKKSLFPITAKELTFTAVESLSTIDSRIKAATDGSRVLLLAKEKVLKSLVEPDEDDCANWSRLLLAAAVAARPFSQKAADADAEEFFNIFINSYLANLDRYAHFDGRDPVAETAYKEPSGIGVRYRRIGKYLEITEILPDSPASESDLSVGDRIAEIDGKRIVDLSRVETLNALRGEKGSEAALTLRKDGKTVRRLLVRRPVKASPVSYLVDEDAKLMTIRIAAFSERTFPSLLATMKQAKKEKIAGLLIDLRGNTGGMLKAAVDAANLFLPEGLLMIRTEGTDGEHKFYSTKKSKRPVYPITILVDARTASSAEYFAGILQEYRHAVVVGTPTYGKGVIQTVENINNDGTLTLTVSRYFLPSGFTPDGVGLFPNVCTSGKQLLDIDKPLMTQTDLKPWRSGSQKTQRRARRACPPESRENQPLDEEIAKDVLVDPEEYNALLTQFSP